MIIALYPNDERDPGLALTRRLAETLLAQGAGVVLPDGALPEIGLPREDYDALAGKADLLMSVGGDGTFLAASMYAARAGIPLVGVNLGNLGYLAELHPGDDGALLRILRGEYVVQRRMMIDVELVRGTEVIVSTCGLNDAVVTKGGLSRILNLELVCDGTVISSWRADGIIVSTATGSTAYAFSAGGPIIEPAVECMAVVPVCAHSLSAHPIVFSGSSDIELVQRDDKAEGTLLWVDGRLMSEVLCGDVVRVRRSGVFTRMVKLNADSFTALLAEKLSG